MHKNQTGVRHVFSVVFKEDARGHWGHMTLHANEEVVQVFGRKSFSFQTTQSGRRVVTWLHNIHRRSRAIQTSFLVRTEQGKIWTLESNQAGEGKFIRRSTKVWSGRWLAHRPIASDRFAIECNTFCKLHFLMKETNSWTKGTSIHTHLYKPSLPPEIRRAFIDHALGLE